MNLLKRALKVAALGVLMRALGAVFVLAVTLFSFYRYRRGVEPPASTIAPTASAPAFALPTLPPEQTPPPVVYQSSARRDPFRQPRPAPAQVEPEVNLKVTGIVQGLRSYYAVVESELTAGTGYVIRENDVVDSARVLKITRDSVIFEVRSRSSDGKLLSRRVQKHIGL